MFCSYCLQLLEFSQGIKSHAPQERPLGGDTRGFTNAQPYQRLDSPSLRFQIHEEDAGLGTNKPVWWRAPAQRDGLQSLLSHSTDVDCVLCNMIFRNVSASIVGAFHRSSLDGNSPFFVYRLTNGFLRGTAVSGWISYDKLSLLYPFLLINERSYSFDMA